MGDDPNYTDHGIVVPDDIVEQLEWHGICVRNAAGLCLLQQSLYEIERLRAENERLRAAGDALAEQMRLAIDARINEQLLLYGLATLPSEMPRSVVAWKEARRG